MPTTLTTSTPTTSGGNTTTGTTTTTTVAITTVAFFQTSDGQTVLAFLILILLLLLAIPVTVYILIRKFCWIKVHASGQGQWKTSAGPSAKDKTKKTQTDVIGLELGEFYRRRQPVDMTKYEGKKLNEVEDAPRWNQLNPKNWNDPWSSKYPGTDKSYVEKVW